MMLEQMVVQYGAPTLAGLKTGSLFSIRVSDAQDVERDMDRINELLASKGVRLTVMKYGNHSALLYLYREALLKQCLTCPKAKRMLRDCGYQKFTVQAALETLRERLGIPDHFPHEIGLFLGYPLSDVSGFIRHCGKNCRLCGCWKVYGEETEAMRTFAQYRKCTDIYTRLFHTGYPLTKLTVAEKSA